MRRLLAVAIVSIVTLTASACGSTLASRWDGDDEAALGEQFSRCPRHEDDGALLLDCGLYLFRAWTVDAGRGHRAEVDRQVEVSLSEPFTGVVNEVNDLDPVDWGGVKVEMTAVTYKPEPDTIVQPSVEIYASQVIDGERQVFRCYHTLAMVTSAEDVIQRIAPCYNGIKALALASH